MAVRLSFDAREGVWTLHHGDMTLDDAISFQTWRAEVAEALADLDHAIDLLVDLGGLQLHPSVAPAFAVVMRRSPRVREIVPYGASRGTVAALKLAYAYLKVHPDRATALARLEDVRQDRLVLRKSGTVVRRGELDLLDDAAGDDERKRR